MKFTLEDYKLIISDIDTNEDTDLSRMARIEMDILKRVGMVQASALVNNTRVISFKPEHRADVVAVLKEYCIVAEVEKPFKPDQWRVDTGDYVRVGGDATCNVCGMPYYDHATVRGYRWLHRACDGRLVKL